MEKYLILSIRIFSVMGLLLFLVLITGRRKIGELPVFDFLTIIVLGNVVGADIADPKIEHLPTAYAIMLIISIQYLLSYYQIKHRKLGEKITFEPMVVIQNGQFVKSNLKKLRYTIENVLMYLREKGVFDISEVEFAIVEDSGNISVLKKPQFLPLTPNDTGVPTTYKGLSLPIIKDGKIIEANLVKSNLDKDWMASQLKNNGFNSFDEVFYAHINWEGKLYISKEIPIELVMKDVKL